MNFLNIWRTLTLSCLIYSLKEHFGTSLVVQWLRPRSQCRDLDSISGQGTRSHMVQLKTPHPQLRPNAAK